MTGRANGGAGCYPAQIGFYVVDHAVLVVERRFRGGGQDAGGQRQMDDLTEAVSVKWHAD